MPFKNAGKVGKKAKRGRKKIISKFNVDKDLSNVKVWFNGEMTTIGDLQKVSMVEEAEEWKKEKMMLLSLVLDLLFKIKTPLTRRDIALTLKSVIQTKQSKEVIYADVRKIISFIERKGVVTLVPLKSESKKINEYVFLTQYGKENTEKFITDIQQEKTAEEIFGSNGEELKEEELKE